MPPPVSILSLACPLHLISSFYQVLLLCRFEMICSHMHLKSFMVLLVPLFSLYNMLIFHVLKRKKKFSKLTVHITPQSLEMWPLNSVFNIFILSYSFSIFYRMWLWRPPMSIKLVPPRFSSKSEAYISLLPISKQNEIVIFDFQINLTSFSKLQIQMYNLFWTLDPLIQIIHLHSKWS